jgi:hypothetical protein
LRRHEESVRQEKLRKLQKSVALIGPSRPRKSPISAAKTKASTTRRSEVKIADDEVAALGLKNYYSVLQFPPRLEKNGVEVIA